MFGPLSWIWPVGFAFAGIMVIVWIVLFLFWIWMIIDAAQRKFRNTTEKIVWIVVVVLFSWLGALVYFIVIKHINKHGLASR
jgi:uncharacterized membrane protein YsdA (DUF1294 family)